MFLRNIHPSQTNPKIILGRIFRKKTNFIGGFMYSNFNDFGLSTATLRGIKFLKYETPTEVQRMAIPLALSQKDLVTQAQTGTGKTSAFGIPIVERLKAGSKTPQCLILVPTRELALQVSDELRALGKFKKFFVLTLYGGKPLGRQIEFLQKGLCDIVVGTPGRVKDLLKRGHLRLGDVKILVLDEADRMLEMGFIEDIEEIISHCPEERQTMLFSATIPKAVRSLAERFLAPDYEIIRIKPEEPTLSTISQVVYQVKTENRCERLKEILRQHSGKTIIFTPTKAEADSLAGLLRKEGFLAQALHGDHSQKKREAVLRGFRQGDFNILVATDVAARGLDIKGVELVINYTVPRDADSYIHRIGRTGRAGKTGKAITLATPQDKRYLRTILQRTGENIVINK
jgi:ATP-dependent RNA helicase DeaD